MKNQGWKDTAGQQEFNAVRLLAKNFMKEYVAEKLKSGVPSNEKFNMICAPFRKKAELLGCSHTTFNGYIAVASGVRKVDRLP